MVAGRVFFELDRMPRVSAPKYDDLSLFYIAGALCIVGLPRSTDVR